MSNQTQKALVVTEIGKPLTLVTDRPVLQPGPSQIQVRVTVAGLNPHDQKCRDRGLLIADHLPAVLANDAVGKVIAVGSDVKRFSIGDRIVGQGGLAPKFESAALQEMVVLDEVFVAKIPDRITDDEAATLPVNLATSLIAIFDSRLGLGIPAPWTSEAGGFDYAGTTLLIIGGGSNCGRFAVQLATLAGIGRIVVVGGDYDELTSYGATRVIGRHGTPAALLSRTRAVVGEDLEYALDTVNPPAAQSLGINALSPTKKGKLARLLSHGQVDESQIQAKEAGYELVNVFGAATFAPDLNTVFWENLPQYLIDGKIKPSRCEIIKGLDAEEVNKVLDRYRDGERVVKPHVHVS